MKDETKAMKVLIKTWDHMVEEFGEDWDLDIDSEVPFKDIMDDLLPEHRVIDVVPNECEGFDWHVGQAVFFVNWDMIEEDLSAPGD